MRYSDLSQQLTVLIGSNCSGKHELLHSIGLTAANCLVHQLGPVEDTDLRLLDECGAAQLGRAIISVFPEITRITVRGGLWYLDEDYSDTLLRSDPGIRHAVAVLIELISWVRQVPPDSDAYRGLFLVPGLDSQLHPTAQQRLVDEIRAILKTAPWLRVAVTCDSPYMIEACRPEEVLVVARSNDGMPCVKPLTSHQKWKDSSSVLTLGEFWSSVGEGWVCGSDGQSTTEGHANGCLS